MKKSDDVQRKCSYQSTARQYGRSKKCPSLIRFGLTLVTIMKVFQNIILSKGSTLRVLTLEDRLEMELYDNLLRNNIFSRLSD